MSSGDAEFVGFKSCEYLVGNPVQPCGRLIESTTANETCCDFHRDQTTGPEYRRAIEQLINKKDGDWRGFKFPESFDFPEAIYDFDIDLTGSRFNGDVHILDGKIQGDLDFTNVTARRLAIGGCELSGRLILCQGKIGSLEIYDCPQIAEIVINVGFVGKVEITACHAIELLDLSSARFSEGLEIGDCEAIKEVSAGQACFESTVAINRCKVEQVQLDGARAIENFEMDSCQISGFSNFRYLRAEANFLIRNCFFADQTSFSNASFHGEFLYRAGNKEGVSFINCVFRNSATFEGYFEAVFQPHSSKISSSQFRDFLDGKIEFMQGERAQPPDGAGQRGKQFRPFTGKSDLSAVQFFEPRRVRFQYANSIKQGS